LIARHCWTPVVVSALVAFGCERTLPPAGQSDAPAQDASVEEPAMADAEEPNVHETPPRDPVDLSVGCTPATMQPVAGVLADDQHPCRAWVEALHGRLATVWRRYAGAYWAKNADGIGLFVTCQHCFDTLAGLRAPRGDEKTVAMVGMPPELVDGGIYSVEHQGEGLDFQATYVVGYTLFAPPIPPGSRDKHGNLDLFPRDDFVVMAVSGDIQRPPSRKPWMDPPLMMPKTPAIFADPQELASASVVTATPIVGEPILALGFPVTSAGQMTFTVSSVLADDEAAKMVSRAERAESRLEYDPQTEFLFPAQCAEGCSGGAVFDRWGRYLGVIVRGSTTEVDGRYFTRVVRATYIAEQLQAALDGADEELRGSVGPLLEPALR
jgi:hypothetical protein